MCLGAEGTQQVQLAVFVNAFAVCLLRSAAGWVFSKLLYSWLFKGTTVLLRAENLRVGTECKWTRDLMILCRWKRSPALLFTVSNHGMQCLHVQALSTVPGVLLLLPQMWAC